MDPIILERSNTLPFTSVADLFYFVGILVCLGWIAVYAVWKSIRAILGHE